MKLEASAGSIREKCTLPKIVGNYRKAMTLDSISIKVWAIECPFCTSKVLEMMK